MNVASVRRWQWVVVGLVAGAVYGYAREAAANFDDDLAAHGGRRIGQREFEAALGRKVQNRPALAELVVTPHRIGGTRDRTITVHVVSGLYCDGQTRTEGGRRTVRWEPAYFVASTPYRPAGTTAEFADVAAYLASSPVGEGVRYARWWWVGRPLVVWTAAGFGVVGLIWPTVVNLVAFGTWRRPREARGISLWGAGAGAKTEGAKPPPVDDGATLAELERRLEDSLGDAPADVPVPATGTPAVKALGGGAALQAAVAEVGKPKDFGAEKEDFYPTELRARHEK